LRKYFRTEKSEVRISMEKRMRGHFCLDISRTRGLGGKNVLSTGREGGATTKMRGVRRRQLERRAEAHGEKKEGNWIEERQLIVTSNMGIDKGEPLILPLIEFFYLETEQKKKRGGD